MKKHFIILSTLLLSFLAREGRAAAMVGEREPTLISLPTLRTVMTPALEAVVAEAAYSRAHQLRPTNEREAFELMQIAAGFGLSKAQCDFGAMWENGIGCEHNPANAVRYYLLAAGQDYAPAENALGRLSELGKGMPQDVEGALTWYGRAVDHRHELATDNLDRLLRELEGKKES